MSSAQSNPQLAGKNSCVRVVGGRQRIFVREIISRLLASPGLNELRRPRLSPCQRCSWLRPRSFVWMHRRECVPKYAERNSIPNSPNLATDTTNNYMNLRSFSSALSTAPLFSSFWEQRKICPEPYQMREASGGAGADNFEKNCE